MARRIARVVSLALLLLTGVLGIYNGITEWQPGYDMLQKSITAAVFLYGAFGLVTAYGLLRQRVWSVFTAAVWGLAVTYAPGAAIMAYGGQDASLGTAIAASVGSAIVALGVVWTAGAAARV